MPYQKPLLILSSILFAISITLSPPSRQTPTDVLIIAPHPDDAVLCCAGLIQQSVKQGKTVHVVDVTDGDGYREAAAVLFNKPVSALTPKDMLRLGKVRRKEEIHGLRELGVPTKNISFLGYPDGWLDEVYNSQRQQSSQGKQFTKTALIADIAALLAEYTPASIYVTSPLDNALDHQIAYRAAMDAINTVGHTGKLYTYIIHTADASPRIPSTLSITLSLHELRTKQDVITQYKSQMQTDSEFLMSFAQTMETFY